MLSNFALSRTVRLIARKHKEIKVSTAMGLALLGCALAFAQTPAPKPARTASLRGHVSDVSGNPAVDVFVLLERATALPGNNGLTTHGVETVKVRTSGMGAFTFPSLEEGAYTLYAQTVSGDQTQRAHLQLKSHETRTVDLAFRPAPSLDSQSAEAKPAGNSASSAKTPEFFDEPQFTVAGVTEASNSGGHGIENIKRASEALVQATGSLGKEPPDTHAATDSAPKAPNATDALESQRTALRASIAAAEKKQNDTWQQQADLNKAQLQQTNREQADLHHQLAQLDETLGDPLESVNEYQRAEELAPSEPHCFDWATELLTHRAFEPATEIFAQGHHHYPQSVRMLLGLGVAWYARGDDEQAAQYFRAASDLAPNDPTPYMFLGRIQGAEIVPTDETVNYLARFARVAPDNTWSNYYYAVGLWKRSLSEGPVDDATFKQLETLLQRALQLDPKFAAAHSQLGTLYGAREDYAKAIAEFQKAIDADPTLEEAHYRLAIAYRRTGNEAGADKEMKIHEELQAKAKEDAERRRKAVQQFVISLRD
jgi:tetratricopeptide (TPR) repeat protein